MRIIRNSILTLCLLGLVLFSAFSFCASFRLFESFGLLQMFPSLDISMWFLALIVAIVSNLLRSRQLLALFTFGLLSALLIFRHSSFSLEQSVHSNDSIRIMTLNVGQFSNDTNEVNRCIQLIKKVNPDVLCLQEFGLYYKWPDVHSVAMDFAEKIELDHFDFTPHKGNIFGTAIFSRFEIIGTDTVFQLISHTNEAKVFVLKIEDQILRVANVHLQSYNILAKSNEFSFVGLKESISQRSDQAIRLLDHKVDVAVGDFNVSPGTLIYQEMIQNFDDAQVEKGNALEPSFKFMNSRIDYIFVARNLRIESFDMNNHSPSDHNALVVDLSL